MTTIWKSNPVKAVFLIILIIGLPLFLAFYEQVFLAYYQQTIADKWASYVAVPLLGISLIYLVFEKYKTYKKSETKKIILAIKKTLLDAFILFIIFILILLPILSGTIILINANIGHQTQEIVEGTIIEKIDYNGSRSHEYKLAIQTDSEILIFDTDAKVITSHYKGNNFCETMYKGSLGLLYNR